VLLVTDFRANLGGVMVRHLLPPKVNGGPTLKGAGKNGLRLKGESGRRLEWETCRALEGEAGLRRGRKNRRPLEEKTSRSL
jgi:hypothetical protein